MSLIVSNAVTSDHLMPINQIKKYTKKGGVYRKKKNVYKTRKFMSAVIDGPALFESINGFYNLGFKKMWGWKLREKLRQKSVKVFLP